MQLADFKKDCLDKEPEDVVQKYLLDGTSHFFDLNSKYDEFTFKKDLAKSLEVHIRNVAIVGSGKLGFSIKPDRDEPSYFPFKFFDGEKKSDLDIAIVSNRLFDQQLVSLYKHTSSYVSQDVWNDPKDRNSLAKYVLKGWIKPDFIPKDYKISNDIAAVQARYKRQFGRDVNIGIYKSWYFFENYHINNVRKIHLNLLANV